MDKLDRQYLDAWNELSDEMKAQLAEQGIHGPELMKYHSLRPECPVERSVDPSEPFAPADPKAQGVDDERLLEALRRLVAEMLGDNNPALGVECLSLVTGLGYMGDSMTEIAERHKVTKQAVSKRCVGWRELLNLPPPRAMRSDKARRSYSRRAIAQHNKRRKSRQGSLGLQFDVRTGGHRKIETVNPFVNRIVSLFGRMHRSGWLNNQTPEQLQRLRADLEPVVAICKELDEAYGQKESI